MRLIQYGYTIISSIIVGATYGTITFDIEYSSTPTIIFCINEPYYGEDTDVRTAIGVNSVSTTNARFVIKSSVTANNLRVYWIAAGLK